MEMLQAMKQKTTPAAVVVKSSPRDSPGAPSTGKSPKSFPGFWVGGHSFALRGAGSPGSSQLLLLSPKSLQCRRFCWTWINPWASPCRRCRRQQKPPG